MAMALAVILLSEWLTRPLRALTALIESTNEKNLSAQLTSKRRDEVGQLTRAFNQMLRRLQKQVDKRQRERDRFDGRYHQYERRRGDLEQDGQGALDQPRCRSAVKRKASGAGRRYLCPSGARPSPNRDLAALS